MSSAIKIDFARPLQKATGELQAVAITTETEIGAVSRAFEGLAGFADTIMQLTATIVECVENENVRSVLPKVQALGAAARQFLEERLEATAGILETVTKEVNVLGELSRVTHGQAAIAVETKALSVLTNIEVAHLGDVGAGFHYLARELAGFSKSVSNDIRELARDTEGRRAALEETRRVLSNELPSLRESVARIEIDLANALATLDFSLTQLSGAPLQFRSGVEDIARQIAGVVTAIQTHDITRQQIEHVQEGLALIAAEMRGDGNIGDSADRALPRAYAGLSIQTYQLRTIRETVANWVSQIRTCMAGILKVSASDMVGIGPMVLEQERSASAQLAQIEGLEREGQAFSERIQGTLGGLSSLMQLVGEHLQKSKSVRKRLQLLTFNSIIEASHLGAEAHVILAIAKSIKEVSADWGRITDQSASAMQELMTLEKHANGLMEAFSEAASEKLREAQTQTRTCLEHLRTAAAFAARQAQDMKVATGKMQDKIAKVGSTGDLLDACFDRFDVILMEVEEVRRQLETDDPGVKQRYDPDEMEQLFSASYTTEMERDVLRAALRGKALPVAQITLAGNSAELF
jgi:hypothetical protein